MQYEIEHTMSLLARAFAFLFWLLAIVTTGCAVDAQRNTAFRANEEALAAIVSNDNVTVAEREWIVFQPMGEEPAIGLILYPGRLCDPRGYAPLMQAIAAAGYLGVIVPMPGNIATNGVDEALDVKAAFPAVKSWAISGHSLGGTAAASFLRRHPYGADALILYDSYTTDAPAMTNATQPILSLYANSDLHPKRLQRFEESKQYLPDHVRYQVVDGADHMQFGSFRTEDIAEFNTATISEAEQRAKIVASTLAFLTQVFPESSSLGSSP